MSRSLRIVAGVLCALVIGVFSPARADNPISYKPLDFFGRDINERGEIVGFSQTADGTVHGVVQSGRVTQYDVPDASVTAVFGINRNGDIVGSFQTDRLHGFLLRGRQLITIDVPGSTGTEATGINDGGDIVGTYRNATGVHGFRQSRGVFTSIQFPNSTATHAQKINNLGVIAGGYDDQSGRRHGFVLQNGGFRTIDVTGSGFTDVFGINDDGDLVGETDGGTYGLRGFMYTAGTFATIDLPCGSLAAGINNKRQIVGDCDAAGFLLNASQLR